MNGAVTHQMEGFHVPSKQSRKSVAPAALAAPANPEVIHSDILTVADVATLLRCQPSSVYNLTRRRGRARYDNPIPVLRLPMGLRFRKSSIISWLESLETRQ